MTPESRILESESPETRDALDSMIRVDTAGLRPAPKHESKPDVHPTTIAVNKENALNCENMYRSTTPTSLNREQTEPPRTPEGDVTKDQSFKHTIYKMVDNVSLLEKHLDDLPRTVH